MAERPGLALPRRRAPAHQRPHRTQMIVPLPGPRRAQAPQPPLLPAAFGGRPIRFAILFATLRGPGGGLETVPLPGRTASALPAGGRRGGGGPRLLGLGEESKQGALARHGHGGKHGPPPARAKTARHSRPPRAPPTRAPHQPRQVGAAILAPRRPLGS